MPPPNIVVMMTDQQRRDNLGCYGNSAIDTPNIDGLADDGVVFENMFVTNVVCMASRASFFTGRYPNSHGVKSNGVPLPSAEKTLPQVLAASGYNTASAGKLHLTPHRARLEKGSPESEEWWRAGRGLPLPYYGFDEVALACAHGPADWADYHGWLRAVDPGLPALLEANNALETPSGAPSSWKSAIPEQYHSTTWVADRAVAFLRELARKPAPFFLFVGFPDPHFPYCPPAPYCYQYDPRALPPARRSPVQEETASDYLRWRWERFSEDLGYHPLRMPEEFTREIIAHTYGMVSLIDRNVGRIAGELDRLGLSDNTIVVYTTDHGEHLGDHGLLYKAHDFDELTRIPCIWRYPGRFPSGLRLNGFANLADLMPTLLGAAGVVAPPGIQGDSFLAALGGSPWSGRGWSLVEGDEPWRDGAEPWRDANCFTRTLRTERHRITVNYWQGRRSGEIYDLEADPDEFVNLWNSPSEAGTRMELLEELMRRSLEVEDPLPLSEAWC